MVLGAALSNGQHGSILRTANTIPRSTIAENASALLLPAFAEDSFRDCATFCDCRQIVVPEGRYNVHRDRLRVQAQWRRRRKVAGNVCSAKMALFSELKSSAAAQRLASNDPEVPAAHDLLLGGVREVTKAQSCSQKMPSFHARDNDVGAVQGEVPIHVKPVTLAYAEHAVRGDFDVVPAREATLLRRDDEFDPSISAVAAGDTLQWKAFGIEEHSLATVE